MLDATTAAGAGVTFTAAATEGIAAEGTAAHCELVAAGASVPPCVLWEMTRPLGLRTVTARTLRGAVAAIAGAATVAVTPGLAATPMAAAAAAAAGGGLMTAETAITAGVDRVPAPEGGKTATDVAETRVGAVEGAAAVAIAVAVAAVVTAPAGWLGIAAPWALPLSALALVRRAVAVAVLGRGII